MEERDNIIRKAIQLMGEISKEVDHHLAQQRLRMAAMDVALMGDDPSQIEKARADLLSVMEAGIDMKIRNHHRMKKFEKQLD